jgi:hypothetical protein
MSRLPRCLWDALILALLAPAYVALVFGVKS